MKHAIIRSLKKLKTQIGLILAYHYDMRRYRRNSIYNNHQLSDDQLTTELLRAAHSIEKALSTKACRDNFGIEKLKVLVRYLQEYEKRSLPNHKAEHQKALNVLFAYHNHHTTKGVKLDDRFGFLLNYIKNQNPNADCAGARKFTKTQILNEIQRGPDAFMNSRRSIRQLAEIKIDESKILEITQLAQSAPSACNRQPARVKYINTPSLIRKILEIQGGSKGFESEISNILIVTSSTQGFMGMAERNQAYIDGGIFFMNLLLACHAKGLATCSLNWSATPKKDINLRRLLKIKDDEVVICLMAVGGYPEEFTAARSQRRNTTDILEHIRESAQP